MRLRCSDALGLHGCVGWLATWTARGLVGGRAKKTHHGIDRKLPGWNPWCLSLVWSCVVGWWGCEPGLSMGVAGWTVAARVVATGLAWSSPPLPQSYLQLLESLSLRLAYDLCFSRYGPSVLRDCPSGGSCQACKVLRRRARRTARACPRRTAACVLCR